MKVFPQKNFRNLGVIKKEFVKKYSFTIVEVKMEKSPIFLATFSTQILDGSKFFWRFYLFGQVLETCHHLMLNPSWHVTYDVKTSLFCFSLYFEASPPAEDP